MKEDAHCSSFQDILIDDLYRIDWRLGEGGCSLIYLNIYNFHPLFLLYAP